jgi:tetratricopeptide (TPR) repeat protein
MNMKNSGVSVSQDDDALTCAVVIGVSKYKSCFIPDLKFSDRDAEHFANMLCEFGVGDIFTITNEEATRKRVLECIGKDVLLKFNAVSSIKRLIVFFSGHGYREEVRGGLPESCLLTHDVDASNKSATGVSLQALIQSISRSEPDEVFIFIDACSVAFDTIPNIFTAASTEKEVFVASKAKHLFAYVASAEMAAFEDTTLEAGIFTECLMRNILDIQLHGGTTADLVNRVNKEFFATGKQNPFYHSMGNAEPWIFASSQNAPKRAVALSPRRSPHINRASQYAQLRSLVASSDKPVYIIGDSGVGKSTFARQLLSDGFEGVYLTIPVADEVSVQGIVSDFAYQAVNVFPSGRPLKNVDATLKHYRDNVSGELIIIDHTERSCELTQALYAKFTEFSLRVVFVGRKLQLYSNDCITWECPKLSLEDVSDFIHKIGFSEGDTPAEILRKCGGLPIRLVDLMGCHDGENTADEARCIDSLSATGGFVDERLFRAVFEINPVTLDRFIVVGKVTSLDDRYVPHDSVINANHKTSADDVFTYWEQQVRKTPTHAWACKQYITAIIELKAIKVLQDRSSEPLQTAINRLFESREWDLIKKLSHRLIEIYPAQHDALLLLAKIFAHRSNNALAGEILFALEGVPLTPAQSTLKGTIESERLWWLGEYDNAKNICAELLKAPITEQMRCECKMHMGVADFFLGNWEEALDSFSFANDIMNSATPQVNAWALYLSATIIGLRGTDIRKGKEQFYAGIRLLEQIGDDSGTASAWGNMAEMTWKLRDYEPALVQATRGYDIAKQTDHVIDQIEITRNILHICFRLYSPFDQRVEGAKNIIDDLINDEIGVTVDMQVWNTYATLYAYRGDAQNLQIMTQKALLHTCGNREYHIYTLANMCLLAVFDGNIAEAIKHYSDVRQMAIDGSNILAIRQMNDDIIYVNNRFNSATSEAVCVYIKPFIDDVEQIIQTQLKEDVS